VTPDPAAPQASEDPRTRAYWFGAFDARPLALFRIALGVALLEDLLAQARGIPTFYTDAGILPRGPRPVPWMWSVLNVSGSIQGVDLIFAVGALATLAFTLGFLTRTSTAATWLFFVSLEHRAPEVHNGGDRLVAVLLFFGFFTDLSGRFSVDAARRGPRLTVRPFVPRLLQAVPALLYAYTAWQKLRDAGPGWFDGSVLFANLHLQGWVRPGGVWLRSHPSLCTALGIGTIAAEISIPVLLYLPFWIGRARALATLGHLGVQLGIVLTLKVANFTDVMFALTPLWMLPAWLDRIGGPLKAHGVHAPDDWTRLRAPVTATTALLFVAMAVEPFMPRTVGRVLPWIGINLNIGLFTVAYRSMRWEAKGELADGSYVDPLPSEADFGDGFSNSLWMQLPYRLDHYAALGKFVCRRHNETRGGPALRSWTLTRALRAPYRPHDPIPAETRRIVLEQEC
jgi:hypothetical protein